MAAKKHKPNRQIFAFGGGGFSMEPENPLLDDYLLSFARVPKPKICFIPTASGDSENYCLRFFSAFARKNCAPDFLPLFQRKTYDLRSFILEQDILFVGGGNTANLLAIWRTHGLDKILRQAYEKGVILSGISAGSLCWFSGGVTDSFGPKLALLDDGLGFLKFSNCPHYDGEPQRRPTYQRLIREGLRAGYAADDGCALHFIDGKLKRVITSRPNAAGYHVLFKNGNLVERKLEAVYLGSL